MKLIVVVSDDMGMMFNNRRQSKDKVLRKHILSLTKDSRLLMNEYTRKQFEEEEEKANIVVDNDCLEIAMDDDYVFVENMDMLPYINKIDEIIMYYWNRAYPSDVKFPLSLDNWSLISYDEFPGNSHELISEKKFKMEEKE